MIRAVTALSTPPLMATTHVLPAPSYGPIRSGASSEATSRNSVVFDTMVLTTKKLQKTKSQSIIRHAGIHATNRGGTDRLSSTSLLPVRADQRHEPKAESR